ncbi:MAG: UbiX family flavin prenyltransferase [Streptococcaceae bacterium]|jgi:4-hydroxy-3-polyprenylbenzoate decarboxylase|nr:UbiX family flavin prenyltransferase [Streptococcaceae bacterium]
MKKRIIVAITGASGIIYAIDFLQKLKSYPVEIHGIISPWAKENIKIETNYQLQDVLDLFDVLHDHKNMGATIASGSFLTDAMVIVPASMKTVSAIAHGYSDNLIARSADVIIKEQRKLIITPRETPLSVIHLENLTKLARLGVQIIPPIPSFYNQPQTIEDLVSHHSAKLIDSLGLKQDYDRRWGGMNE